MSKKRRRAQDARQRTQQIALRIVLTLIALGVLWYFTGYSLIMATYDILTVIGVTIVLIYITSQFVLPVTTDEDRNKARQRMSGFMSRANEPVFVVKDGEVIANRGEEQRMGPGVILVYPGNAVVIETATRYVNSFGPGVVFLERGQRLRDSLELREHVYEVFGANARTRDGIELKSDIIVRFMLARGNEHGDKLGNWSDESGPPYFFEEQSAFAAVYGGEAVEEAHENARWSDLPIQVAVDLWRELLLNYKLNELFPDQEDTLDQGTPYQKLQETLFQRMSAGANDTTQIDFGPIERNVLKQRGIAVRSVEIRNVRVPQDLQEKFKDQWRERWQRNSSERAASADIEISGKRRQGETQARHDFIRTLTEAIPEPELLSDKAILTRLINQAVDATDRPSIVREVEPHLRTIEAMRKWLRTVNDDGGWRRDNS